MKDKLLTIQEAAELLCVSAETLRSRPFRKRIGLNVVRIGRAVRFSQQELDAFIARNVELSQNDN